MNDDSKRFVSLLQKSIMSSFMILFAGIILGSLILPMKLEGTTHFIIMVLAVGLFFLGIYLQIKREEEMANHTKVEINDLKRRVGDLENKGSTNSEDQNNSK